MSSLKNYETRKEIPIEYRWNLSDIYESYEKWEIDYRISE